MCSNFLPGTWLFYKQIHLQGKALTQPGLRLRVQSRASGMPAEGCRQGQPRKAASHLSHPRHLPRPRPTLQAPPIPVYGKRQLHLYPATSSIHVPWFRHGLDAHSLMLVWQLGPGERGNAVSVAVTPGAMAKFCLAWRKSPALSLGPGNPHQRVREPPGFSTADLCPGSRWPPGPAPGPGTSTTHH